MASTTTKSLSKLTLAEADAFLEAVSLTRGNWQVEVQSPSPDLSERNDMGKSTMFKENIIKDTF